MSDDTQTPPKTPKAPRAPKAPAVDLSLDEQLEAALAARPGSTGTITEQGNIQIDN